jgi:hypothetical protein
MEPVNLAFHSQPSTQGASGDSFPAVYVRKELDPGCPYQGSVLAIFPNTAAGNCSLLQLPKDISTQYISRLFDVLLSLTPFYRQSIFAYQPANCYTKEEAQ